MGGADQAAAGLSVWRAAAARSVSPASGPTVAAWPATPPVPGNARTDRTGNLTPVNCILVSCNLQHERGGQEVLPLELAGGGGHGEAEQRDGGAAGSAPVGLPAVRARGRGRDRGPRVAAAPGVRPNITGTVYSVYIS